MPLIDSVVGAHSTNATNKHTNRHLPFGGEAMANAAKNKISGLTDKQELFAELVAYNPELNDSDAYRQSYNTENMKTLTINRSAHKVKNLPGVAAWIAHLREERAKRTKIDADWVLARLAAETNADLADIYSDDGGLKPVHQWPKIWRQGLVAGIDSHQEYDYIDGEKIPAGVVQKIRLSDRVKRLELIGKHVDVQAFKEKVEVDLSASQSLADLLGLAASEQ